MSPDDLLRDGRPHRRKYMAHFPDRDFIVTEWTDDDGTVNWEAEMRTLYGEYSLPVELKQVG